MLLRIIAATVAGAVTTFAAGFVIYGLLLDPMLIRPNIQEYAGLLKDPPSMIPLVLSNFTLAFLLAVVFEKWAGVRTFLTGAGAGAIITFLITLYFNFSLFAFMRLFRNFIPMLSDLAGSLILGALVGGVIGLVLGAMNKTEA
jgi:hypothetical protein